MTSSVCRAPAWGAVRTCLGGERVSPRNRPRTTLSGPALRCEVAGTSVGHVIHMVKRSLPFHPRCDARRAVVLLVSGPLWAANTEPGGRYGERNDSRLKKALANVSELLHDAFLLKSARSKEKQWQGLNGREKLLFLEAFQEQWSAWQENAAATVTPPAEAKVIRRTLRKQGFPTG